MTRPIDDAPTIETHDLRTETHGVCSAREWIPVSDGLPADNVRVNITWTNRKPEPYYKHIKDERFTGTAVYFRGTWHWDSSTVTDMLAEYGRAEWDRIDKDIEVLAWMPLPEPWGGEEE